MTSCHEDTGFYFESRYLEQVDIPFKYVCWTDSFRGFRGVLTSNSLEGRKFLCSHDRLLGFADIQELLSCGNDLSYSKNHFFLHDLTNESHLETCLYEALESLSKEILSEFSSRTTSQHEHVQVINEASNTRDDRIPLDDLITEVDDHREDNPDQNGSQKLVDLSFDEFGKLAAIQDSMSFIPEKFVKKYRSVYIKYMKMIVANCSKHPERNDDAISEEEFQNLISLSETVFDRLGSSRDILNITGDRIRKIIMKRPKLKRAGIDKSRYDHLQTLIGFGGEHNVDENQFAQLFADIIVLIIDDKVPKEVYDTLRDNELIALPKSNGDVRPVGMGSSIRKICSILFLSMTSRKELSDDGSEAVSSFNESHFARFQYGMAPKGTEIITHISRLSLEKYPERDVFFMDADNAFNQASRLKGLIETMKHFPIIIPFLNNIYGQDLNGWYFGLTSGITPIMSHEGFHQGDVL